MDDDDSASDAERVLEPDERVLEPDAEPGAIAGREPDEEPEFGGHKSGKKAHLKECVWNLMMI